MKDTAAVVNSASKEEKASIKALVKHNSELCVVERG
jgi:hypothetical protein